MENCVKQEPYQVKVTVPHIQESPEFINRLSAYRHEPKFENNLITVKTEPFDETRYKNNVYKHWDKPEANAEDSTLRLDIKWKNESFNETSDSSDEFIEADYKAVTNNEIDYALVKEDMEFEDHDILSNASETSQESNLLECNLCDYKTPIKDKLEAHFNTHDPSKLLWYHCTKCNYKTRQRGHLSRHDLVHRQVSERELFTCAVCDHKFKQKCTLKRHIANVHTNFKTQIGSRQLYKCRNCLYTTSKRGLLASHLDKHKDVRDITSLYVCDICSFLTKYRRNLRVHLETHKESQELQIYECKICRFKSRMGYCLKRHFLSKKHLRTVGKLEEYCPRPMKLKLEKDN